MAWLVNSVPLSLTTKHGSPDVRRWQQARAGHADLGRRRVDAGKPARQPFALVDIEHGEALEEGNLPNGIAIMGSRFLFVFRDETIGIAVVVLASSLRTCPPSALAYR